MGISKTYDAYCRKKTIVVKKFLKKSDSILDIGCGTSDQEICLAEFMKYPKWKGLDLNPPKHKRIMKGDIRRIKIRDNSFNVVLCLDVIEHFKNPKPVMRKMSKIAKNKLIIVTPVTSHLIFRKFMNSLRRIFGVNIFQGHYYEFFENEVVAMADGMKCSKVTYIPFPLPIPTFSKLLFKLNFLKSGIFVFQKV